MKDSLTERSVKAYKPGPKAYEIADQNQRGLTLRVEPSGSKSFYVRYYDKNQKSQRHCLGQYGKITLSEAKELLKKFHGAIAAGWDPKAEKQAKKEEAENEKRMALTLGSFVEENHKAWLLVNHKSGKHSIWLLDHYSGCFYHLPMMSITRQMVEHWQVELRQKGLQPESINRPLMALKTAFRRAYDLGLISNNPVQPVKYLNERKQLRVRYLKPDERQRLLQELENRNQYFIQRRRTANEWRLLRGHAPLKELLPTQYVDHLQPMVLVAINTGLRRGELLQLKWSDVDFDHRVLTVRAETAKSSKTRRIPLNGEVIKVLETWKQTNYVEKGLVFSAADGGVMKSVNSSWTSLIKKAKITDFRFHDLRHDFASQLVMKGVDLNMVRELLGHTDFMTTLRYAHVSDDAKAKAVERLCE